MLELGRALYVLQAVAIMAKESVAHATNSTARSIRAGCSVLKISGIASLLPGTHESIAVRVCRHVAIAR